MKFLIIIICLLVSTTIFAQIIRHESEGNLKSDTKTVLANISEITNQNNPVDNIKYCVHAILW